MGQLLGAYYLMGWLFPPPQLKDVTSLSLDELKIKYKRFNLICGLLLVPLLLLIAAAACLERREKMKRLAQAQLHRFQETNS